MTPTDQLVQALKLTKVSRVLACATLVAFHSFSCVTAKKGLCAEADHPVHYPIHTMKWGPQNQLRTPLGSHKIDATDVSRSIRMSYMHRFRIPCVLLSRFLVKLMRLSYKW